MSIGTRVKKAVRRVGRYATRSENKVLVEGYERALSLTRWAVNTVTPFQLGWGSSLQAIRWLDDTTLEIQGWAFERGNDYVSSPPVTELEFCQRARRDPAAVAEARITPSAQVNRQSRDPNFDYSTTAFVAQVDVTQLAVHAAGESVRYQVFLQVEGGGASHRGWFKTARSGVSVDQMPGRRIAGTWVQPTWVPRRGLVLQVGNPKVAVRSVSVSGRSIEVALATRDIELSSAWLESEAGVVPLRLRTGGEGVRVEGELPALESMWADHEEQTAADEGRDRTPRVPALLHSLRVADDRGREHLPVLEMGEQAPKPDPLMTVYPRLGPEGGLAFADAEASGFVTDASLVLEPTPELHVRGVLLGSHSGARIALEGRRQQLPADMDVLEDGTFTATVPLLASRWGSPPLAPMAGWYTLVGLAQDGRRFQMVASRDVVSATPKESLSEWFRVSETTNRDRSFVVRLTAPIADDELGTFNQARLESEYQKRRFTPTDSVYLESFYGRQATCNPLALDRLLAEQHPELRRFWGVVDRSVWTPEGSTPVVEGTREWWDARGSARYVIANDWLRRKFLHQPHQVVLQTWHGSMLKRIGLDRPSAEKSTRMSLRRERDKWDLLVSQNRHSTEIFKTAYEWTEGIVEEGYPRNDLLTTGDREAVRQFLGIAEDQIAVLYAPTWRDNVEGLVTFLDLEQLTRDLGDGYVVLLRGHSRIMGQSSNVEVPGVIDVTTHPNISELFLASDAMVTDYSSVMFDFSVTGRPMIFFVPDMDDYRDSVRGVYFDLSEVAPGPVVATQQEVLSSIRSMSEDAPRYEAAYLAWRERFNALDDGNSAQRVLDRLLSTKPRASN